MTILAALMDQVTTGIAVLLFSILCIWRGTVAHRSGREALPVIWLMVAGLALRIFVAADPFLHEWDERFHALVAKNMMEHPFRPTLYETPLLDYDYRSWLSNHIWLHKPPLPLWSISLSMKVFGVNEWALRIPSILLSTLGILLTWSIGNELYNRRVGFIAAFLFTIHGLIIELTGGRVTTDHYDVFFLFFILASIWAALQLSRQKKTVYQLLCGIFLGMALLSKWLPAMIILPVALLMMAGSGNFTRRETALHLGGILLTALAVALPWHLYIHRAYPLEAAWESSYNFRHLTEAIEGHEGPFYYHFNNLRIIYGELVYLPVAWFLWKTVRKPVETRRLLLTTWFLVPFLFFSLAESKMQAYTLFTAPAIFIITGVFWHYLKVCRSRFRLKWIVNLILLLLLALPVRYSLERIKPFSVRTDPTGMTRRLKEWAETHRGEEKIVFFNMPYPIEAMFYIDCVAYRDLPPPGVTVRIEKQGYRVVIWKEGRSETDNHEKKNEIP